MQTESKQNGVGVVDTQHVRIDLPPGGLTLEGGGVLPELTVAYETYGELAPEKDNVIFICHALSGDAHAAGYYGAEGQEPGWWHEMVGPGKGIDTRYYHVVCANILGGCMGTTGPASIDPRTGRPYGSAFPQITVGDMVDVHRLLLAQFGITTLAAVVGGSFGGMQALEWAIRFPEMIKRCICIASAASLSSQALAFDIVGRTAISSDPDWRGGDYYGQARQPVSGLSLARKIGHITYLSQEMMKAKFGRERRADSGFQVAGYLEHQGRKFVERFDANTYLHITRAMDEFDLVEKHGSLESAFASIRAKLLVVALSADWLFPPEQSVEIANALLRAGKEVSYCRLLAPHGHDAFLVDIEHLAEAIRAFLPWVDRGGKRRTARPAAAQGHVMTPVGAEPSAEYSIVRGMVRPGARVLDLGCGPGRLLSMLAGETQTSGMGVDIDIDHVIEVIDRGHDAFHADIDGGLAMIPDRTYDFAILSGTLQVVRKPRFVLSEMLRVAAEGIVSFPNFGKWSHRVHLGVRGRMPKGGVLPFEWHNTPNIHLFTLRDFVELCREDGIKILDMACVSRGWLSRRLTALKLCNLGADLILVKIARGTTDGTVCRRAYASGRTHT